MVGAILSLASAFFESGKDVYLSTPRSTAVSHVLRAFLLPILSLPFVLIAAVVVGYPTVLPAFWWYVIAHAFCMVFANYCYLRALATGAVSETQPILALTPALLLITTPLLTHDEVTLYGWIGVLMVALGIYASQHPEPTETTQSSFLGSFTAMWSKPGISWMVTVAVIFSITSNLDKLAISSANGPAYLVVDFAFTAVLTGALVFLGEFIPFFPRRSFEGTFDAMPKLLAGGAMNAGSALLQMSALTFLAVPYVIAIKRLSIVFTSLWGYFIRHERAPHWYRVTGVVFVFCGVAVILILGKI